MAELTLTETNAETASPSTVEKTQKSAATIKRRLSDGKPGWLKGEETNSRVRSFEDILRLVGPMGAWQLSWYWWMSLCNVVVGMVSFSTAIFAVMTPPFSCQLDGSDPLSSNATVGEAMYSCYTGGGDLCENITFATRLHMQSTIVTEWSLVCANKLGFHVIHNALVVGFGCGYVSAAFVGFADRFGRKRMVLVSLACSGVCCFLNAVAPNLPILVLARVLLGFSLSLYSAPAYAWGSFASSLRRPTGGRTFGCELTTAKYRSRVGGAFWAPWYLGTALAAPLGSFLPHWRQLQFAVGILSIVMALVIWWALPESARWLLVTGRVDEAGNVIRYAAFMNKAKLPRDIDFRQVGRNIGDDSQQEVARHYSIRVLCSHRVLVTRVAMDIFWVTSCAYVFWGLAFFSAKLTVDVFVSNLLLGVAGTFGPVCAALSLALLPRKLAFCTNVLTAAVALLAMPWLPKTLYGLGVALKLVAKVASGSSWSIIYVFCNEFFPTSLRGTTSQVGAVGYVFGAITAGFVEEVSRLTPTLKKAPLTAMGASMVLSAVLMLIPPETSSRKLPDHLSDVITVEGPRPRAKVLRKESLWSRSRHHHVAPASQPGDANQAQSTSL